MVCKTLVERNCKTFFQNSTYLFVRSVTDQWTIVRPMLSKEADESSTGKRHKNLSTVEFAINDTVKKEGLILVQVC